MIALTHLKVMFGHLTEFGFNILPKSSAVCFMKYVAFKINSRMFYASVPNTNTLVLL